MDCSPPSSSVHGIFQAIVLEWIAISFSRGSSRPRDPTQVSLIVDRHFTIWATGEVLKHTVINLIINMLSEYVGLRYLWHIQTVSLEDINSKESTCNSGDTGYMSLIPRSGRTPGGGNGNLFQYSCLKNPIDRGAWWATIHGIIKSETWLRTHAQRDVLEVPLVPEKIFVSVTWGAQRDQGLVLTVKNYGGSPRSASLQANIFTW